jgi:hypothetical protein
MLWRVVYQLVPWRFLYRLVPWRFYIDWCSDVFYIDWCPVSCVISIEALVLVLHRLVLWHFLCIDKYPGSCFMSNDAVAHILYRLVPWCFCIDWWSGMFFYLLVPWLILYIHCGFGSFLVSIGALVRVLYRMVLKFVFYIDWWFFPCFVHYWCPGLRFELASVYMNDITLRRCWRDLAGSIKSICSRRWSPRLEDLGQRWIGTWFTPAPGLHFQHTHTYTHTHIHTVYKSTVSGWLPVNRGGLHRVCTILRRFTWNLRPPGMWHILVLSVPGISNGRDNINIEGCADPRINPSRTLDMKEWKRLLGYTASYSRKPKCSSLCKTIILKPNPVMYFLSPYRK